MIETIKAWGTESEFFARWAGCDPLLNAEQGVAMPTEVVGALPVALAALTNAAVPGSAPASSSRARSASARSWPSQFC